MSGKYCNGKYPENDCPKGLQWRNGSCHVAWKTCTGLAKKCTIGDILYSDGTCSSDVVSSKTAIGVVVYISSDGCGQAFALKGVGGWPEWSVSMVDVPTLTNYTSASKAKTDFASCENTSKLRAQGNMYDYEAAWSVNQYFVDGTEVGDWCLPAAGVAASYIDNKEIIDNALSLVGGSALTSGFWTSTEYSKNYAWYYDKSSSAISYNNKDDDPFSTVRLVIEF